jgi:hypothetical protein
MILIRELSHTVGSVLESLESVAVRSFLLQFLVDHLFFFKGT